MATNLKIDDALLAAVTKIGRFATKKDAVNSALKEFLNRRKQQELKNLFGELVYSSDYNYKKSRQGRKVTKKK